MSILYKWCEIGQFILFPHITENAKDHVANLMKLRKVYIIDKKCYAKISNLIRDSNNWLMK